MERALAVRHAFNPPDIANTLWALATLGRQPDEALVVGLTERALVVCHAFSAQDVANTLWAFATQVRQPDDELVAGLTGLAVLRDMTAHDIANTLWALATLGRQPDEALMAGLMERAFAVRQTFNPQDIAQLLWALATFGRQPSEALLAGLTERVVEVCDDFMPQAIANTLWAFASLGQQPSEVLVAGLEARAVAVRGDFKPQEIANTMWAFASLGQQPGDDLIAVLEARALVVRHAFNPPNIANTLWAFVTLGRQPDRALLEGLTDRALVVRHAFSEKDIGNTLWAICFLSILSPVVVCRLVNALELPIAALAAGELDVQLGQQLHQFFVACEVDKGLCTGMPASILALKETLGPACLAAFMGKPLQSSWSKQQVSQTLRGIHLLVEDEVRCPRSGYTIDMWVHGGPVLQQSAEDRRTNGWAVEFDGPMQFMACRAPTGETLIKRHHIQLLGYTLVSVPFWEWDRVCEAGGCEAGGSRELYMRNKLHLSTITRAGSGSIMPSSVVVGSW